MILPPAEPSAETHVSVSAAPACSKLTLPVLILASVVVFQMVPIFLLGPLLALLLHEGSMHMPQSTVQGALVRLRGSLGGCPSTNTLRSAEVHVLRGWRDVQWGVVVAFGPLHCAKHICGDWVNWGGNGHVLYCRNGMCYTAEQMARDAARLSRWENSYNLQVGLFCGTNRGHTGAAVVQSTCMKIC